MAANEVSAGIGTEELTSNGPAISVRNVTKRFGHVEALRGVSLDVMPGEIVAMVGDNGAGKSTLMKTICGVFPPDSGTVQLSGRPIERDAIRATTHLGLGVVYQDLALALDLRVYENIFLGHDMRRPGLLGHFGVLNRREMAADARRCLDSITRNPPPVRSPVRDLSGGQRQMVAIARAIRWARSAVIMDEPTAALGVRQTERVGEIIQETAARGIAVLLVSHDMPSVLKIAHRIVVLRHGVIAADLPAHSRQVTIPEIVGIMLGESASPGTTPQSAEEP